MATKFEKSSQSKGHRHLGRGRVLDKNQATPGKCETKVLRHVQRWQTGSYYREHGWMHLFEERRK